MKKMNNGRYRQNSGNSIYSLNYKFDSVSAAGKFSGTALDLIKKYNELAKEAHSNGDYVEMEVFRQYAEHYRKIVTEINERKNQVRESQETESNNDTAETSDSAPVDNGLVETQSAQPAESAVATSEVVEPAEKSAKTTLRRRRSFTIVEVTAKENNDAAETKPAEQAETKPRRRVMKRTSKKEVQSTDEDSEK